VVVLWRCTLDEKQTPLVEQLLLGKGISCSDRKKVGILDWNLKNMASGWSLSARSIMIHNFRSTTAQIMRVRR